MGKRQEREIGGMWEKIRADVAFDDVADDEVAPRSDVALTCHIYLDQRVAFPPHQPTHQHQIILDILLKIESNFR